MDLQHDPGGQAAVVEGGVEAHQGHLEDVGGQALDPGVHGLALAGLADAGVLAGQLGDLAAAAEQGLGVALAAGLGHGAVHVVAHGREGLEVGVEDHRRLLGGDVEALGQPVGLHAVGQPVGDHLRPRPLLHPHLGRVGAEHPGGGGGVDVVAGLEGGDQPRIGGQVGDAAKLDLVVVGHQQAAALGGDEGGAEHPAPLGPDRDVVQVGGVGAEPAGPGHGLVEGGPDAVAGPHLAQQPLAVGGPQLLQLPVVEQVLDHRMGLPEPLQGLGVGGVAGLGPLQGREPQLVEQDLPELLGGVEVELASGGGDHRGPHLLGLGGQLVADAGEDGRVDADPDVLHAGQHPHQGGLDVVVQVGQALGGQGLPQRRGQPVHRQSGPGGLDGRGGGRGVEVEVELARGRIRFGQLQAGEAGQHLGQVVAVAGGVEQVGGQHGVQAQVHRIDTPIHQIAQERLGPVHGQRRTAGAEHPGQGSGRVTVAAALAAALAAA